MRQLLDRTPLIPDKNQSPTGFLMVFRGMHHLDHTEISMRCRSCIYEYNIDREDGDDFVFGDWQ